MSEHSLYYALHHPSTRTDPTLAGAFPPEGERDSLHICQSSSPSQDNLSNILNWTSSQAGQFGTPRWPFCLAPPEKTSFPAFPPALVPNVRTGSYSNRSRCPCFWHHQTTWEESPCLH